MRGIGFGHLGGVVLEVFIAVVGNTLSVLPRLVWYPLGGTGSKRHLLVQLVNLFETEAFGLVNEEVDKGNAEEAATEPDEEDLGLQIGIARAVVDEIGGRIGDGPVEKPVGGRGDTKTLGTHCQGEDLASDDPSERTPGGSEEKYVDTMSGVSLLLNSRARPCLPDKGDRGLVASLILDENITTAVLTGR